MITLLYRPNCLQMNSGWRNIILVVVVVVSVVCICYNDVPELSKLLQTSRPGVPPPVGLRSHSTDGVRRSTSSPSSAAATTTTTSSSSAAATTTTTSSSSAAATTTTTSSSSAAAKSRLRRILPPKKCHFSFVKKCKFRRKFGRKPRISRFSSSENEALSAAYNCYCC